MQEFLATYKWEEDRTRDRLQEMVVRENWGPNSIGIVTVHLGYATGDFHCLLDGDLFLPED